MEKGFYVIGYLCMGIIGIGALTNIIMMIYGCIGILIDVIGLLLHLKFTMRP